MSADAAHQAAKHGFQTEVARLLHLMVHSVYTEKDVFLRELISNASDACDKLRYEAIADPDLLAGDARLAIRIEADKAAGTLTVADNGIGMDEQELIENLGTIARSGTRAFLDRLSADTDSSSLIGQFGVGFYSAFMVADRIQVVEPQGRRQQRMAVGLRRRIRLHGHAGAGGACADKVPRGTAVTLILKKDAHKLPRGRMRSSASCAPTPTTSCFRSSSRARTAKRGRSTRPARFGSAPSPR